MILDELIDEVNELISLGHGDLGRLTHIKNTLERNGSLFDSDRKYLKNLVTKYLNIQRKTDTDLHGIKHEYQPKCCGKCGTSIQNEAEFCIECGFPINERKIDNKTKSTIENNFTKSKSNSHKQKKSNKKKIVIIMVALVIVFFFVISAVPFQEINESQEIFSYSDEELNSMSITWSYDDVMRNFEKYDDEIIHFGGPIQTIDQIEDSNRYAIQVKLDCKPWPDTYDCNSILVDYTGKRLLMGDKVDVFGKLEKIIEADLVMGGQKHLPLVKGLKVTCTDCP